MPLHSKLSYSTDVLVAASKKHVAFLRELHRLGVSTAPVHYHSVKRYIDFWLPLVARQFDDNGNNKQELIPPPDIAWLWHCHRLAPGDYQAFVTDAFGGKLVEAKPPFAFQQAQDDQDATQLLWKKAFPSEPFFLEIDNANLTTKNSTSPKRFLIGTHDLIASAKCQAAFLWQVSGPCFRDDAFLEDGVRRYIQFLQITDHTLPLVPTYQIDLMWHTHMLLSTKSYNQDCINIRGSVFYHDDSLNDRRLGSDLDQSYRATMELWQESYKELYEVKGGMYRGEPPASYWTFAWQPGLECNVATKELALGTVANGATSSGKRPSPANNSAFVASTPSANEFPPMDGYVFGHGRRGLGYYSLDSNSIYIKDAYKILLMRLDKRIEYKGGQMGRVVCMSGTCCGCGQMNARDLRLYDKFAKEMKDMKKMKLDIEYAMRHRAIPPAASLTGASDLLGEQGPWYTNYAIAAACGGGVPACGGCGGGGGGGAGAGGGCGDGGGGGGCGDGGGGGGGGGGG